MIKSDCIDAEQGRKILRNIGLTPMPGAANVAGEFWVEASGHPHIIPYCKKGDNTRFLNHAFEKVVDEVTS